AGEVGPKPKSVKDRVPAFLEVVETDEFSVFRADAEEPLWVLGRDAVIVVEVVGRRISPGRSLDKQFRCREFNSEVHARPSFAGEDRTALRNVPCQDVLRLSHQPSLIAAAIPTKIQMSTETATTAESSASMTMPGMPTVRRRMRAGMTPSMPNINTRYAAAYRLNPTA